MSLEDVQKVVKTKTNMYKACIANGIYMPAERCSIITTEFLNEVRH